jgi:hypothetical protein
MKKFFVLHGTCIYIQSTLVKKRFKIPNQNPYIEDEQTKQWPKEKLQKDKQRSTKDTHKTKNRVKRTPLKTGGELRCYGSRACIHSRSRYIGHR